MPAGFLSSRGAQYRIAHESEVGLDELRRGRPCWGALNNDWGVRLAEDLRFTFRYDPDLPGASIMDGGETSWSIRLNVPFASVREDRGLVTRVRNRIRGQPTIVSGGLTMLGTLAAAALLTGPGSLPEAEWERANAQVVFATTVLRGSPAPPRVLDTWFW
jgi:hypothetical protein